MIVAVDGRRVASLEELRDALADHKPGDTVESRSTAATSSRRSRSRSAASLPRREASAAYEALLERGRRRSRASSASAAA